MRKMTFGAAFTFACIGVTCASATSLRVNDGHSVGDFGVGGWTQNFSAKPFTGGGVSVQSSPVQEVVDFHATLTRRELTDWRHPPLWLPSDDDCLFVSSPTSAGHRWRPSCK